MKFRKLLLCLFAGILMTAFANHYTYAAEDDTIVTEEATMEDTTIDNTTQSAETDSQDTNTDESAVISDDTTNSTEESTKEAEEEAAAAEEAAAKKEAAEKAAAEKAAKAKAAAEKVAAEKAAAEKAAKAAAEKEAAYSKADLRLLSALIYCEANGESYNGKLAVGIVVMNRKRSGAYPDTVKGVIYQKYQFGPASNGALTKALKEYDNDKFTSESEKACIKAAKAALSGTTTITVSGKKKDFSKYLYFSGSLSGVTYTLGNHEFK